jgi:C-terminal processing protease CtpA/Prc
MKTYQLFRINKQIYLIIGLIIGILSIGKAQKKENVLHSTRKHIYYTINHQYREWIIAPEIKPDILEIFDPFEKTKKVKFISDIDSIEFIVKINKPIDLIMLYNNDTAYTQIKFINYQPNTISMKDKLLALSMFWSEVRYNFVFYDQLTFDWDSLYQAYIPLVMETKNNVEFDELMQKFVGSLQDGHTNYQGSHYHYPYTDYIGMSVRYFNDTLRIVMVDTTLVNTFPIGSKIIKINGISTDEYMGKYINPYVGSKFKQTQELLAAYNLFSVRQLNDKLTLTYITPQGEIQTNTPPREGERFRYPTMGKSYNSDYNRIRISWLENNIALLTINSFNDPQGEIERYFEKYKDTLYHADGIIIDIRANGGGSTATARYFLKHIIKDAYFLNFAWQARINNSTKKANGNYIETNRDFYTMQAYQTFDADTIYIEDSIKRFDCPIIILIATGTVSAAEDFLIMLYERPDRPLFIGRPSFGSTGSPLMVWNWPIKNSFARICARRVLFPYSKKIFDTGIIPDIWVKYSFEEYMDNIDKDIEIAIKELKKQIQEK